MAKKRELRSVPKKWHYISPVGVLEARRAKRDLVRFDALTRHYFHFAHDMVNDSPVPKLESLIPNLKDVRRLDQLNAAINRIIPIVQYRFFRASVPTSAAYKSDPDVTFDIIQDFFDLPEEAYDRQLRYQFLISRLDRAIGTYDYQMRSFWGGIKRFWRGDVWKPSYLFALAVNFPLRVFRYSGFNVENEKTSDLYFWILKIMMLILLSLLIAHYGVSLDVIHLLSRLL